jgi:uncharacterized membrane protein YccC
MSSTAIEAHPKAQPRIRPPWLPVWSRPAAFRALRATIVVPGLFAISYKVIGDLQLATFAAFGGFATLVMAGFGGTRRDKAIAHLGLALAGSVLLVIGTAVNSITVLAAIATVVVGFVVLFAGLAGPNAAAGVTAALLAYVLPAASPGTISMIPARLEGWWLASVAGTIAVLLLSPRPPGDRLRAAARGSAGALADQLEAALRGEMTSAHRTASVEAKHELMTAFTTTPYRPTGLTTTDQALDSLVGLLEWCTAVICDSLSEYEDLRGVAEVERDLLAATAAGLREVATLLDGDPTLPDLDRLESCLAESVSYLHELPASDEGYGEAVHLSFHARTAAFATRTAVTDALITARRADREAIVGQRRQWYGIAAEDPAGDRRLAALTGAGGVALRHASLRSVWFVNSIRGAVALAAAITVADLTGVQHGFWVVLGTLSVLRTSATSTGSTAMRALAGTTAGFLVGAVLILLIGTNTTALWVALPVAVLVASYAPGAAPFAVGQAAFTVVVSVLYNLLVPVGWKVGVLRIEDVAIGCAVSLVVGLLFWPRGASGVVGDDLADAYRQGGDYLSHAAHWALGLRHDAPEASRTVAAGNRLDEALRGFLAEQGAKRIPKEDLWRLVGGATRLRLTAHSLAGLPSPVVDPDPAREELGDQAIQLATWFDQVAVQVGRPSRQAASLPDPPDFGSTDLSDASLVQNLSCALWVEQHLRHITPHLCELVGPVGEVSKQRRNPWWR